MCLAVPGKVAEISGDTAKVDYGSVMANASASLIDDLSIGDVVIVHAGFIIQKVEPEYYDEFKSIMENPDDR